MGRRTVKVDPWPSPALLARIEPPLLEKPPGRISYRPIRGRGFMPQPHIPRNMAVFSAQKLEHGATEYTGGTLTALLGGYEVDLTQADIRQSPAVLNVLAIWGGIEIKVPDEWDVVSEVTPVMAGVEVTAPRSAMTTPRTTSSRRRSRSRSRSRPAKRARCARGSAASHATSRR